MKTILFLSLLLAASSSFAQASRSSGDSLMITFNKTSSLVFSSLIKSVDLGSPDVLAQIVKGAENVLQLKAAVTEFPETNVTVITSSGELHQFRVLYTAEPDTLFYSITGNSLNNTGRVHFKTDLTEDDMQRFAKQIIEDRSSLLPLTDRKLKMKISLSNIYVHQDVMLFKLSVINKSNINYDLEYMRFFIKDKKRGKRTATQELELPPILSSGNVQKVNGQSSEVMVFAMEKLTIPDAKRLIIELFEHNGGRHLRLKIKNRRLVRAKLI